MDSFYEYLAGEMEAQNTGRTALKKYGPFETLLGDVQTVYDLENDGITADPNATVEIVPYSEYAPGPRDCNLILNSNLVSTRPAHHDGTPYEVWTFESRQSCVGLGICDGSRVGRYWGAPLDPACGISQDLGQFKTSARPARRGPDKYRVNPQICNTQGGGAGGASGIA